MWVTSILFYQIRWQTNLRIYNLREQKVTLSPLTEGYFSSLLFSKEKSMWRGAGDYQPLSYRQLTAN
jgi:hypothetical protein